MAALRDIARDFAAEIRDGIGWTIVYRTGRSWNALTIWSDIWNGEWETDDLNDARGGPQGCRSCRPPVLRASGRRRR